LHLLLRGESKFAASNSKNYAASLGVETYPLGDESPADAPTNCSAPFLRSSLFIGLLALVSSARAQEPNPPSPLRPIRRHPSKDPPEDKDKDKSGATVGKSKLEKETGTVNDRIFEVMPNYGTVENAKELPALTKGQKFRLATAGVFDWGSYPFNGILIRHSSGQERPQRMGAGMGAPTENVMAHPSPTTASAPT